MSIDRAELKQNAKATIRTTDPSPIMVILVYLAIMWIFQFVYYILKGNFPLTVDTLLHFLTQSLNNAKILIEKLIGTYVYSPKPKSSSAYGWYSLAYFVILCPIDAGLSIYCLKISQSFKAGVSDLFGGFRIFFKVLWLNILMAIFFTLWSMLLIVPGIIAAYSYRMALYIMIDNPQLSALDCITQSKRMMDGNKGELFVLDLSFIGWYILNIIPLVSIWVTPYKSVTNAYFYLTLRNSRQSEQSEARDQSLSINIGNTTHTISSFDTIEYKGYIADIFFDYSSGRFFGSVKAEPGIAPFSADSIEDVTSNFYTSVDSFLEK